LYLYNIYLKIFCRIEEMGGVMSVTEGESRSIDKDAIECHFRGIDLAEGNKAGRIYADVALSDGKSSLFELE